MELRKLRDKATEAFTKGRFAKAAELYAEYCEQDPRDIQARLRMGDAWAKAGERPRAISAYKSAAEAFAREGFLPRAIAASKLILELDPSHQGVQQMLADLYARKGGGKQKPAEAPPAEPGPRSRAPIELDPEAPSSVPDAPMEQMGAPTTPRKRAPIEVTLDDAPPTESPPTVFVREEALAPPPIVPQGQSDLPPELEVFPSEAPAASTAPPGLRRKPQLEIIEDVPPPPEPIPSPEGLQLEVVPEPPVAAVPAVLAAPPPPPAHNEVIATASSRIWLPGAGAVAADLAPARAPEVPAAPPAPPRRQSDLERALSKFDELSLEDAPGAFALSEIPAVAEVPAPVVAAAPPAEPPAAPPQMTPARLPSFTELELEGDSLLHAVEVAALAGQSQRGEETADDEEEVFSITADVSAERPTADELPKIPLFSDLPPDAFIELFDRCPLRRYGSGERIIAQGSVGDAFYVVCEGEVRVVKEEGADRRELAMLKDGAFFGEMALLSGAPRSATVESASEDTQLLEISAPVLAQLSHRYPSVAKALKRFCRQRMLANVMNSSPLFRPFSRSDRKALVERFRARDVPRGTEVIREGGETDGLYVVLSGEVEVTRQGQALARLQEGEIFGEMSLLRKTPASATVTASRRTSLLRLPRADFDELILSHPQILILVSELTEDRQRQTDAVLSGSAEVGDDGGLLLV